MTRWALLGMFVVLLLPAAGATQIATEDMRVTAHENGKASVIVERTYNDITSEEISYLVSSQYAPENLQARDSRGLMDCEVDTLEIGNEILCEPRQRANYTVEITFDAAFTDTFAQFNQFTYLKRVLVPTDSFSLRVMLPEGYGTVGNRSYSPETGEIGSEGRRIFITWHDQNVEIGDSEQYQVRYEKLRVLEQLGANALITALIIALIIVGALAYHFRSKIGQEKTIAAVFPVLKEDEQEILQYIIDHEGEVEQREIVSAIDYSKAKISTLLSDLAERDLIEKEKRGRVNVVRLAREVGDL